MIPDLKACDLITSSRGSRPVSQVFWAWLGALLGYAGGVHTDGGLGGKSWVLGR